MTDHSYNVSKLIEVLLVREIAASNILEQPPSIIVNSITPGLCHSDIARDLKGFGAAAFSFVKLLIARSTEHGSRTLVHASSAGIESHGQFLYDCQIKLPSQFRNNLLKGEKGSDLQEQLYKEVMAKISSLRIQFNVQF